MFDVIALDADDTLWHNEPLYEKTQEKYKRLLSRYVDPSLVAGRLYQTEKNNIHLFGYGIKSFTLSMIENAIVLSNEAITGREIGEIIGFAREMLETPVHLIDDAHLTVQQLAKNHRLMLLTKGDLLDQLSKLASSGLERYFDTVEVVREKSVDIYERILEKNGLEPGHFMMVGNSLKSDILPVLDMGGTAVYVPYELIWDHEKVHNPDLDRKGYHEIETLGQLPALVEQLESSGGEPSPA